MFRRAVSAAKPLGVRTVCAYAPEKALETVNIHRLQVEALAPRTPIFATTTPTLNRLINLRAKTADIGQQRKEGRLGRLSNIHPHNVLDKNHRFFHEEPAFFHKQLMAAGAFLSSVEDCQTVRDQAVEMTARMLGYNESDKSKLAHFAMMNPTLVKTFISAILHELARKGYGSAQVPLGPDTVPLMHPGETLQVYGEEVAFAQNHKLFSILQMQSPVHEVGLHTVVRGEIDVFRITHKEKEHGLHHSILPVMNLEGVSALNIRDVLKFYASHLGARAFDNELKRIDKNLILENATEAQLKIVLDKCLVYSKKITKGDTFMSSTGLGPNSAATTPSEALGYFNKNEYVAEDLLKNGFTYIDERTGEKSVIRCAFDAPRRELHDTFISTSSYDSKELDRLVIGFENRSSSYKYERSIDPAYRAEPPGEISEFLHQRPSP